jgi:hypothetical protein
MASRKIAPNAGSPKAAPTITQHELMVLGVLQARLRAVTTAVERDRQGIETKMKAGASVEPGEYQLLGECLVVREVEEGVRS